MILIPIHQSHGWNTTSLGYKEGSVLGGLTGGFHKHVPHHYFSLLLTLTMHSKYPVQDLQYLQEMPAKRGTDNSMGKMSKLFCTPTPTSPLKKKKKERTEKELRDQVGFG